MLGSVGILGEEAWHVAWVRGHWGESWKAVEKSTCRTQWWPWARRHSWGKWQLWHSIREPVILNIYETVLLCVKSLRRAKTSFPQKGSRKFCRKNNSDVEKARDGENGMMHILWQESFSGWENSTPKSRDCHRQLRWSSQSSPQIPEDISEISFYFLKCVKRKCWHLSKFLPDKLQERWLPLYGLHQISESPPFCRRQQFE